MGQVSRRTSFNGSALIRLLSRLTDIDAREPAQPTADRLSQWFRLDRCHLAVRSARWRAGNNTGQYARSPQHRRKRMPTRANRAGKRHRRRHHLRHQQGRNARLHPLSPTLPRPATGDGSGVGSFAQPAALGAGGKVAVHGPARVRGRGHGAGAGGARARLLSAAPGILEKHFERLRKASQAPDVPDLPDGEPEQIKDNSAQPDEAWLACIGKDAQDVLLAELDFRFQPVEGLLEALRTQATRTT